MPLYRIALLNILLLLLFSACGSDDDGAYISLRNAKLSFHDSTHWVHARPPDAMVAVQEQPVQKTVEVLNYINLILLLNKDMFFRFDESEVIVVDTAVLDAKPAVRYRTSLLLDSADDTGYACQVSVEQKMYIFNYFFGPLSGDAPWLRRAYAEERVDRTSGLMKVFGYINSPEPTRTYTWQRDGDEFSLNLFSTLDIYWDTHIKVNQRTKAGSLDVLEANGTRFKSSWTATGAGEWVQYAQDGTTVATAGTWAPTQ